MLLVLAGGIGAVLLAESGAAGPAGSFTKVGTVGYVVDGDTLDVRLGGGGSERVRVIGIDTPERGDCYFAQARSRARSLALGRRVVLRGDATQSTRDRYGRLLAYVDLPGGDLGLQLVRGGFGKVYVYDRPFQRVGAYRRGEQAAQAARAGLWRACGAAAGGGSAGTPSGSCHPSYTPCLPIVGDLDCADVRRLGKAPVRVSGSDPYRLDGDGDGWGCD